MLGKNSPNRQRQLFHYFRQMSFECFGIQPVLFDAHRTQLEKYFFFKLDQVESFVKFSFELMTWMNVCRTIFE